MITDADPREINFDGLVGPTHNYSGLAHGNLASARHAGTVANPRQCALQGLAKMKTLHDDGFAQALLPPHERPDLRALRRLGFSGRDHAVIAQATRSAPELLHAVSSAAAMWTANAATVTPGIDSIDGRVHLTPANLLSSFHRALETPTTAAVLRAIFADEAHFAHHPALPAAASLADEGAANHSRLCAAYGASGVHLFVYGERGFGDAPRPLRFRPRQTLEASQAVARQHGLDDAQCVFAQQHPQAIDAGVFHNDVIAVANGPVLLYHERAFTNETSVIRRLRARLRRHGTVLCPIRVTDDAVPLDTAVRTYLFNSQLLTRADGTMLLVVPSECDADAAVQRTLADLVARPENPITAVRALDVRQSMRNGGGPACLRLRIVLNAAERAAMRARILFDGALHADLNAWVTRHYRDRLAIEDLADPALLDESRTALDALTVLLQLGSVYPFQQP